MFPEIPLTPEAETLKKEILAIPRTDEALDLETLSPKFARQRNAFKNSAQQRFKCSWVLKSRE